MIFPYRNYYTARYILYSTNLITHLINIYIFFSLERQQVIVPGRRAMATGVHPSVTAARMQEVEDFVVFFVFCLFVNTFAFFCLFVYTLSFVYVFVLCLSFCRLFVFRQHFIICLSFLYFCQHFVVFFPFCLILRD